MLYYIEETMIDHFMIPQLFIVFPQLQIAVYQSRVVSRYKSTALCNAVLF